MTRNYYFILFLGKVKKEITVTASDKMLNGDVIFGRCEIEG